MVVCCTENGVDGLQFTRSWLTRASERVNTRQTTMESTSTAEASTSSEASVASTPVSGSAANATLNAAFLELLDWDDDRVFPEVMLPPSHIYKLCYLSHCFAYLIY